ncbi:MAG TPA: DoxX family membrane protein [Herpetosiphonaceae bacterium]
METQHTLYRGIGGLVLRLWLGYEWLSAGLPKVFGEGSAAWIGPKAGAAVTGFLKGALARAQFDPVKNPMPEVSGWYADFISSVALPNAALFSYLVAFGEVLVGLALILGLFTRFSAAAGGLMNLNYLLSGVSGLNPLMLIASVVIIMFPAPAAGWIGLDRLVSPRLARLLGREDRRQAAPA